MPCGVEVGVYKCDIAQWNTRLLPPFLEQVVSLFAAKLAEQHITVDQMANHILLIISKIISGETETPVNYIFVPHSEVLENKCLL